MSLVYRFRKEKLEDGSYVSRPRILVLLKGPDSVVKVPALIDSGCDVTVIPEGIFDAFDINFRKAKNQIALKKSTPFSRFF